MLFSPIEEEDDLGTDIQEESDSTPPESNEDKDEENEQPPTDFDEFPPPESEVDIAIRVFDQEARERVEEVRYENSELHKRILGTHGRRRSIVDADMLEGQDFFYQSNLGKWLLLKDELKKLRQHYLEETDRQHDLLQKTQIEARDHNDNFSQELLKIAREAQQSVSGQILSEAVLAQIQERNKHATLEMEKCRIVQRQLLAHLYKLDQARKKKDQLPEGLHLVDYEQLKMENESLSEKIHAKNEEILIMRKKRTTIVHALSHVREKLQFVEKDTKISSDKLNEVEHGLHQGRIDLHSLKSRCDRISQKKQRLQKSMVNISDPLLLDDLENLKDDAEATEEQIAELRQRYDVIHREMRARTRYMSSQRREEKNASEEEETDTNSSITVKHNLRWGEERSIRGR